MKKIDWNKKAKDFIDGNRAVVGGMSTDSPLNKEVKLLEKRIARGMKAEHMLRKLQEMIDKKKLEASCPRDIGCCDGWACPLNQNYDICWRRLWKELES